MATPLATPVSRELPLREGAARPLIVQIRPRGIHLRGKGTQRSVFVTWENAVRHAELPGHFPASYTYEPLRWLETD